MGDLSWIAPTIAALAAAVVAIIAAIRSRDTGQKVDKVAETVVEIRAATNGSLHAVTAVRDLLAEKVEALERALTTLTASGDLAAETAAQAATDVRAAQAVTPPTTESGSEG